jgi:hypothetical protein
MVLPEPSVVDTEAALPFTVTWPVTVISAVMSLPAAASDTEDETAMTASADRIAIDFCIKVLPNIILIPPV